MIDNGSNNLNNNSNKIDEIDKNLINSVKDELEKYVSIEELKHCIQNNPLSILTLINEISPINKELSVKIMDNPMIILYILTGLDPDVARSQENIENEVLIQGNGPIKKLENISLNEHNKKNIDNDTKSNTNKVSSNKIKNYKLTCSDLENIEKIKELTNIEESLVEEAYICCDKNVESTVNFLFDN